MNQSSSKHALDDQHQSEGQQHPVEVVQAIQVTQQQPLNEHSCQSDGKRRHQQRNPISDADPRQQHPGHESSNHELSAVQEVDHIEQAEDDCQAKAQHGVERPVHQTQQKLTHERICGDAKN